MTTPTDTCTMVALTLRAWSARKHDPKASDTVTTGAHAQRDAARVNKLLMSKAWLGPIQEIDNQIRAAFYRYTLAYSVTSIRLLPESSRQRFDARMAALLETRTHRVDAALDAYHTEREASRKRLGDMFNESDYPTVAEIAGKYSASVTKLPMPAGWKAGVDDESLRAEIDAARAEGFSEAYRDAWTRVADYARTVADKLSAFRPANDLQKAQHVFRDSLVDNGRELVETLESMVEMFGDDQLTAALAKLKADIGAVSPDMLREDDATRARVTGVALSLVDQALAAIDAGYTETGRDSAPVVSVEPVPAPTPTPAAQPAPTPAPAAPKPAPAAADFDFDALLD